MRILLLHKFHHRLGGAERIYFETAKLLEEAGHEVAFFSMRHPENDRTPWEKYFVREVDYSDAPKSWGVKLRTALAIIWNREATRQLDALITDFRPDAAHAFNVFHQLSPAVFHVLKRRQVPIALTICDFKIISPNYFLYHFGRRKIWESTSGLRAIWDRAVKDSFAKSLVCAVELWVHRLLKSYDRVDVFLAPSAFLVKKYRELGFAHPITQIHHPVRVALSDSGSADEASSAPRKESYLYFGRLSPEKGVDVALRALARLPEKELVIVGYGPAEDELRSLVREDVLGDRVKFLGPLYGEELNRLIRESRAIIFPVVWYENQPFALMDALASGTPVIASRIGGIPDVVRHGENGFLFAAGDPEDLARVWQEFSRLSPETLLSVRARAETLSRKYTKERYRDEILAIYQALSGKKKNSP